MTDKFQHTPYGVFKDKERKPGEKTQHGNMPDIFKLQWPVYTSEGEEPTILVYNEKKTWTAEMPITDELRKLFKNGEILKLYMIATPQDDGQLIPTQLISGQSW